MDSQQRLIIQLGFRQEAKFPHHKNHKKKASECIIKLSAHKNI